MRNRQRTLTSLVVAVGFAALMLSAPAFASAATRFVDPTGSDAGPNDCLSAATPCQHIQYAVFQAAANDTVQLAAGTYNAEPNNQVLVNKGLTITGAGIGQSILDGNSAHGLPTSGTLSLQNNTSNSITVSGLTIRGAGSTAATHGSDTHYAIFEKSLADFTLPPPAVTLDSIRVEGNGNGGRDYSLYSVGSSSNLTVQDSQFVNSDFNPILLERHQGPADINGNTLSKATGTNSSIYFDMNYQPGLLGNTAGFAQQHRFRNNVVNASGFSGVTFNAAPSFVGTTTGGYDDVQVTGNTFTNVGAATVAVTVSNDATDGAGTGAEVKSATVSNNSITGPGAVGIRFRGLVSNITASNNQLTGFTRGIQFNAATGGHAPGASNLHFNRLVNDSTAGVERNAGGAVNAENNWWGCNEGPNSDPGCSPVVGASVDFDPWLVLGVSASPTSVEVGGQTSTVTANLNKNSDGQTVGTAHPDGFPVAWSTDLGSIAPPSSPLASGTASSTLTSGAIAGTAHPAATVDNETTSTPVTFTDTGIPDTTITSGPTNGVTIADTSATFSFTSDDATATFECRFDSANPGDFASCTTPKSYTGLANGPHVFEVRAVDVNNNRDGSPARAVFNVDTTPPIIIPVPTPGAGSTAGQQAASDAGPCANRIAGDNARNKLKGTNGGDRILGYGAADKLKGRGGFDCLKGSDGPDRLNGGLAGDIIKGGSGDDVSYSRDGNRDNVNCGPGQDMANADQFDVLKNCETIHVSFRRGAGS